MKLFNCLAGLLIFCFTSFTSPTTVNGRFSIVNLNSSELSVLLQINTNTGTDDLGGATIVLNLDTLALSFTGNPVRNVDYVFHNFSDGNYSPATVTRPLNDKIWVNIDLPFNNNNNGTLVAADPGWTDVVTIHFDIEDTNGTASLIWLTTSPFWGVYDADNTSLWQAGEFEDLHGPLPVELISFTGTLLSNEFVLLEWKTASEVNHYGFEIEKATSKSPPEGETPEEWETIGFVESYGNPSSLVEYNFTDVTLHAFPVVKYRLKSIDNDGSFEYSEIIEVNNNLINYELSQNYPNPFNPSTRIIVRLPQSTDMKLVVYNAIGEAISELANGEFNAGTHKFNFDASGLASGVYIYRVESVNFVETKKMILLH